MEHNENDQPKRLVQITEDYFNELRGAKRILNALLDAGVNNWEGYDDCMKGLRGD